MPTRWILLAGTAISQVVWICALPSLLLLPAIARADSGTIRVSQRSGNRQITVFTDPTPLRAGPVDVSILIQDNATGAVIMDEANEVEVAPRGLSTAPIRYQATSSAASNKLFQAANFDLPYAGWWEFTINIRGQKDSARVQFEAEAGEPLPPWQALWPWFCWPFLVVAIFVLFQFVRLPGGSKAGLRFKQDAQLVEAVPKPRASSAISVEEYAREPAKNSSQMA